MPSSYNFVERKKKYLLKANKSGEENIKICEWIDMIGSNSQINGLPEYIIILVGSGKHAQLG